MKINQGIIQRRLDEKKVPGAIGRLADKIKREFQEAMEPSERAEEHLAALCEHAVNSAIAIRNTSADYQWQQASRLDRAKRAEVLLRGARLVDKKGTIGRDEECSIVFTIFGPLVKDALVKVGDQLSRKQITLRQRSVVIE